MTSYYLINIIFRLFSLNRVEKGMWNPIELMSQPFQQTTRPDKLDSGVVASTFTMGMIFSLVPVSLAVDMVYDREVGKSYINIQNALWFYLFSDQSKKSTQSQWSKFINVLHNIFHHTRRTNDSNMCSSNSVNFYIRSAVFN